jgi:hypothetical protein
VVHEPFEDEAARGVEIAVDLHLVLVVGEAELSHHLVAPLQRDEPERLLVHRARLMVVLSETHVFEVAPLERVERAVGRTRVLFQSLFQETRDGRFGRPHRAVQEDDALFRTVPLGCRLEDVHQAHQRNVQTEDGVGASFDLVFEEVVTDELLLVVDVLLGAVTDDHVVNALERVTGHLWTLAHDLEVVFEGTFPRKIAVQGEVLQRGNLLHHVGRARFGHLLFLSRSHPSGLSTRIPV